MYGADGLPLISAQLWFSITIRNTVLMCARTALAEGPLARDAEVGGDPEALSGAGRSVPDEGEAGAGAVAGKLALAEGSAGAPVGGVSVAAAAAAPDAAVGSTAARDSGTQPASRSASPASQNGGLLAARAAGESTHDREAWRRSVTRTADLPYAVKIGAA
jgi:hypothetical protein